MADLTLDIVSDVSCPWCAIGYYRLAQALDEMGLEATIRWHPYEINPHLDYGGTNLIDNIRYKYGGSADDVRVMREKLTSLGAEVGFEFRYSDEMEVQNSMRAHQLVHWASDFGKAHKVKLALFDAFFRDGKNIADIDMLADLAGEQGLHKDAARAMLADDALMAVVREDQQEWISRGVTGVPTMIARGKYAVTGAQPVPILKNWLSGMMTEESPV